MLCEECRARLKEPLPPELDRFAGIRDNLIRALWGKMPASIPAEILISKMYRGDLAPEQADNVLRVTIHWMRPKIKDTPYRIETVRGRGYRLIQK